MTEQGWITLMVLCGCMTASVLTAGTVVILRLLATCRALVANQTAELGAQSRSFFNFVENMRVLQGDEPDRRRAWVARHKMPVPAAPDSSEMSSEMLGFSVDEIHRGGVATAPKEGDGSFEVGAGMWSEHQ